MTNTRAAMHSFALHTLGIILAVIVGSAFLAGSVHAQTARSAAFLTVGGGFNSPYEIAPDSTGNVFVIDRNNNAIKEIVAVDGRVSATSTVVTLVSGLNQPGGLAIDSQGNVFFSDSTTMPSKK